jgi:hypothetical protein
LEANLSSSILATGWPCAAAKFSVRQSKVLPNAFAALVQKCERDLGERSALHGRLKKPLGRL